MTNDKKLPQLDKAVDAYFQALRKGGPSATIKDGLIAAAPYLQYRLEIPKFAQIDEILGDFSYEGEKAIAKFIDWHNAKLAPQKTSGQVMFEGWAKAANWPIAWAGVSEVQRAAWEAIASPAQP